MATLLVNRNCMESLQKDITDLQGTVINVFSRTGAVRYPSWKFPDKVSCDLDLVSLLGHYDFVERDPEFTQHSHVVLLELVIDRLLLLLQSFTGYTENLISEQAVPPFKATGPGMSIGLAVRKYWNSMLKLGALHQQLVAEQKRSQDDISSLKCCLQAAKAENQRLKSSSSALSESDTTLPSFRSSPLTSSTSSGFLDRIATAPSQAKSTHGAARCVRSVHTQTIESSLVPCDACERAQASLREVASAIIHICNSQNLPSSLSKFLEMVEETLGQKRLTATDLSYWASEQSKDLSRINKHLQALMGLVNPLKAELEESGKQKDELKKQLETSDSCLQEEKNAQEQWRKEAELQFEKRSRENLQLVAVLEKDKEALQKRAASLEEKLSALEEELQLQQATIQELERTKSNLLQEMKAKMVEEGEAARLQEQLEALSKQLESTKQQLNWTSTELDKERAKAGSMLRHKESLQAKQRALMQQLDNLDQECEQLKASLADEEDGRSMLQEQLSEIQEEKWEIQRQLEAQQELTEKVKQEKLSLEQSTAELQRTVSELGQLIQELKERERLLVSFPDLHIPVETHFESTGDIVEDMGKQLQANNIRISILEEENSRLRTAVAKMKEAAQQEAPKLVPPTQLWAHSSAKPSHEDDRMHPPTGHFLVTGSHQGAVRRSPIMESSVQNGSRGNHASSRNSSASQRTPSGHLEKAPFLEPAQRAGCSDSFPHGDTAASTFSRAKGSRTTPGHLARCTRTHWK